MKQTVLSILMSVFLLSGSGVFAVGEKTIVIGAGSGWDAMETRSGVTEISLARPHPVLALSSAVTAGTALPSGVSPDLHLSFDQRQAGLFADSSGRWYTSVSQAVSAVTLARLGSGAAQFTGVRDREGPLVLEPGPSALFASRNRVGDFTIEFWILPLNLENGEEILHLSSGLGNYTVQRVQCTVSRNRLNWSFSGFFADPVGGDHLDFTLSGAPVLPGTWSHHLIRYNAGIGLVEYLVNGKLEAVEYATSTRAEGGEVYTPLIGDDCRIVLGNRYSGLIDEFSVHSRWIDTPALAKYGSAGRAETRTLDLGTTNSRILKIEASGGQIAAQGGSARNTFAGTNRLSFADNSEIQILVRANDTPYQWDNIPWVPVGPGEELDNIFSGRFIQVAADFYPSGDGETSPYLDELRIIYRGDEPPPPPAMVTAIARDGAVELSWRPSSGRDIGGYLVYFGTSGGEYFGEITILEKEIIKSPIDTGNRTSVRIEGLTNGTLYYFVVAAYNHSDLWNLNKREAGEFSREVAVRPLRESYSSAR